MYSDEGLHRRTPLRCVRGGNSVWSSAPPPLLCPPHANLAPPQPPSAPLPCSQKGGQNPFPTQPHAPDLGTSFSRLPGHSLEPFLSTPPNPASRESEAAHVCPAPGPGGSVCCIPAKPFLPLLPCPLQRPSPTTPPIHQPHLSWDQKHCRSPTLPTKPSLAPPIPSCLWVLLACPQQRGPLTLEPSQENPRNHFIPSGPVHYHTGRNGSLARNQRPREVKWPVRSHTAH